MELSWIGYTVVLIRNKGKRNDVTSDMPLLCLKTLHDGAGEDAAGEVIGVAMKGLSRR